MATFLVLAAAEHYKHVEAESAAEAAALAMKSDGWSRTMNLPLELKGVVEPGDVLNKAGTPLQVAFQARYAMLAKRRSTAATQGIREGYEARMSELVDFAESLGIKIKEEAI